MQIRSTDGTSITKWDTESAVCGLGYHPDDCSLATGHYNGTVQIRSTDGTSITKWDSGSAISALAFHPNGRSLATGHQTIGHENGTVQIRSTDGTSITEWSSESEVGGLGYHPDGCSLATGHHNGTVQIYNMLPVLTAHACKKRGLTIKQWLMLKVLHDNTTNKPLYLNTDGKETFDSLRETVDEAGEKKPGIDNFYLLQKRKTNDTETDEAKKRWCIVPKTFDPKKLDEARRKG